MTTAGIVAGVVVACAVAGTATVAVALTVKQRKKLSAEMKELRRRKSKINVEKHFKRERFIGNGGCGDVYAWKHKKDGVRLAAKEVVTGNIKYANQLLDEAEMLAELEHENVVTFFAAFFDTNYAKVYMFMELMSTSLGALAKKISIPEKDALAYTCNMLDGLIYIHSQGIIHCDIKGDNVLLDNKGTAKLADLGISKYYSNSSAALTTRWAGSLPFMSPELMSGTTNGKRSDLWAVGCTVMEMLHQSVPFFGENIVTMMEKIKSMEIKDLAKNMEASDNVKEFLAAIFVKLEERPYPEDIRSHNWLLENRV